MRSLLALIFCIVLCVADSPPQNEETLKRLSAAGENYLDEEIKQSLLGMKKEKEMMEKKEEKHRRLMDALRHSRDKKKGAEQLTEETERKLEEAEQHCQDSTQSFFASCQPCLEDSCKAFYTSTCRRGFASFSAKTEDFFRRMANQVEAKEPIHGHNQKDPRIISSDDNQVEEDEDDQELLQAEASFNQLLSNFSLLYNHSIILVRKMQQVFGPSFLAAFSTEVQPSQDGLSTYLSRSMDHILDSVYDFGKNMLEDFSFTVAEVIEEMQEAEKYIEQSSRESFSALGKQNGYLCRQLRRQASECWQLKDLCETCKDHLLKDCSSVQQLHSEVEQMYMLLNASRQQYDDRLLLVQRYTASTQRWLSSMNNKYGWISQMSSSTIKPHDIFRVISLKPQQQMNSQHKEDTSVIVSILDSSSIAISVPGDLEVDEPAFIQFVAEEALTFHKRWLTGLELCKHPNIPTAFSDDE